MKNILLRVFAGSLTFALGVSFIWLFTTGQNNYKQPTVSETIERIELSTTRYPTSADGKVDVRFRGFKIENDAAVAEFEAVNFNSEPVFYSAYLSNRENAVSGLARINGQERTLYLCGTGMIKVELKPGEAKIFKYSGLFMEMILRGKRKNIQIGYFINKADALERGAIYSNSFDISDEVGKQLDKEMKLMKNQAGS